jgi:hypothetical protein
MSKLPNLNRAGVQKADADLYAAHPELNGRKLSLGPEDRELRREWLKYYTSASQSLSASKPGPGKVKQAFLICPTAKPPTPPQPQPTKQPIPTLKVRWSKPKITPNHNSSFPPKTPPTDTIPEEAKVQLLGETTNVPDGITASMTISHSHTGSTVTDGNITGLIVRGGKVLDPATGNAPEWVFEAKHILWDPWDKPYYFFNCKVEYEGLSEDTPKDSKGHEAECLRLAYWHNCVAESSTLTGVLPECTSVAAILNGVAHSKALTQNLTTENVALDRYGSLLRNTYVFHMASHGNVLDRATGTGIGNSDPGETAFNKSEWRSVVHIAPAPRFGDAQVMNLASIPSVPKYLFYSSTCLTGWESSFADALISRGTRNVLAFRRSIPDSEAPVMANKFYTRWAKTYKLDPSKIPECFFKAGADHYHNMKPILYGAGGGAIKGGFSALEIASIAVAGIVGGVLIGVAVWALLRK